MQHISMCFCSRLARDENLQKVIAITVFSFWELCAAAAKLYAPIKNIEKHCVDCIDVKTNQVFSSLSKFQNMKINGFHCICFAFVNIC